MVEAQTNHCNALIVEVPGHAAYAHSCTTVALACIPFTMLSPGLIRALQPRSILMPLFAGPFDVLTLIDMLSAEQFGGRVLVLAPPLPDRAMVLTELQAHGPRLRLRLLMQPRVLH